MNWVGQALSWFRLTFLPQFKGMVHHKESGRQVRSLCPYAFLPADLCLQLQDVDLF